MKYMDAGRAWAPSEVAMFVFDYIDTKKNICDALSQLSENILGKHQ